MALFGRRPRRDAGEGSQHGEETTVPGTADSPAEVGDAAAGELSEDELRELGLSADDVTRAGGLRALATRGHTPAGLGQENAETESEIENSPVDQDLLKAEAEEAEALGLPRPEGLRHRGPFDSSEVPGARGRIDVGSLWIPGVRGMQVRLDVDPKSKMITGVNLVVGDSNLQLHPYAAPRSGGLWDEIRGGLLETLGQTGSGGTVVTGPLGPEIHARMPVKTSPAGSGDSPKAPAPVRFVGIDGPRWFVRGVISGRAAVERDAAAMLYGLLRATVVVRGDEPMEPRSLLPLRAPSQEPENGSLGATVRPAQRS